MSNILVNVKTEREIDGCFSGVCSDYDELREFIKSRAALFRNNRPSAKCVAFILLNGKPMSSGRTIDC